MYTRDAWRKIFANEYTCKYDGITHSNKYTLSRWPSFRLSATENIKRHRFKNSNVKRFARKLEKLLLFTWRKGNFDSTSRINASFKIIDKIPFHPSLPYLRIFFKNFSSESLHAFIFHINIYRQKFF